MTDKVAEGTVRTRDGWRGVNDSPAACRPFRPRRVGASPSARA